MEEDVPIAIFMGNPHNLFSNGTWISPPPIPSNPAVVPVTPPVIEHLEIVGAEFDDSESFFPMIERI